MNTHCITGCTHKSQHLTTCKGDCQGCLPRQPIEGSLLCQGCHQQLAILLNPRHDDGLLQISRWLADNLGQHLRHATKLGSPSRHHDNMAERLTTVMDIIDSIQVNLIETAEYYAETHNQAIPTNKNKTRTGQAATYLYTKLKDLPRWEPIGELLNEWLELRHTAHTIAPWHGIKDQPLELAKMLYRLPPETTSEVCERFTISTNALLQAYNRKGIPQPTDKYHNPMQWRPWDVFAWLHHNEAQQLINDITHTHHTKPTTQN